MATLYGDAAGRILRLEWRAGELGGAPPGTATTVEIDQATNAAVLRALDTEWNSHDLVGGVLRRNGQPVPLDTAAAQAEATRLATDQTERDALAAIRTRQQTYLDTPLASITGAMTVVAVKDLIRVARWLAWNQTGRQGNP